MAHPPRILAFAGSARIGSYNKLLLKNAVMGARAAGAEVTHIDLLEFPLPTFNEDVEAKEGEHPNAKRIKDLMRAHDGFLISSPENNGSVSALLKNVMDFVSRRQPNEKPFECTAGKVVAVMSASPGALGGLRGLFQLRYLLQIFRCFVLPDQVTVSQADKAFNPDGTLKDTQQQATVERLGALLAETLGKLKT